MLLRYSLFSSIAFGLLAAACSRQPEPEKTSSPPAPPTPVEKTAATAQNSPTKEPPPQSAKPDPVSSAKPIASPSAGNPPPSSSADKPPANTKEIPADERDKLAGLISFISERDGQREVYIIKANGTGEKRFSNNKHADYNGPFAPDNSALLVIRVEGEDGPQKLYLWPLDGREPKRLGPDSGRIRFPNFTPDGKFVVFESNGSKELVSHFCDIYRIDTAQGKKFERLTNNPEGNFEPAVAPKGDAIVHISSRDRVAELYAMKSDGKSALRLTKTDRDEWGARFSPDGKQIAFVSDREGADRIWLMDFPNGEARRLTQRSPASRIVEDKIAWAPSGKKIAYVLTIPETPSAVVIFDLETGKETFLRSPFGAGQVTDPAWSPDGRHLAVTITSGPDQQIWITRENGSAWFKLTSSSGGNWNPIWGGTKPKK